MRIKETLKEIVAIKELFKLVIVIDCISIIDCNLTYQAKI